MALTVHVPADLVAIAKARAADPTNVKEYERIVMGLASDLKKAAQKGERAMFEITARQLSAEWSSMTKAQQNRVLAEVGTVIERHYVSMQARTASALEEYGRQVAQGTRRVFHEKLDPNITASLTSDDRRFIARLSKSRAWYVKNRGEVLSEEYSASAADIIVDGASKGLSDKQVGKELHAALNSKTIQNSEAYYRVVANAAMNRSRTWASLQSYDEAGFTTWQYSSVLDERTTDQCRWLHGKTWTIRSTIDMMNEAESKAAEDPESIRDTMPWITTVKDKESGDAFFAFKRDDKHVRLAQIYRSAVGQRDRIGSYEPLATDAQLQEYGVIVAPIHGL